MADCIVRAEDGSVQHQTVFGPSDIVASLDRSPCRKQKSDDVRGSILDPAAVLGFIATDNLNVEDRTAQAMGDVSPAVAALGHRIDAVANDEVADFQV